MKCRISRDLLDRFAAEAVAAMPEEACGLLLGRRGEISAGVPLRNVAAEPWRGFELDPPGHLAASRRSREAGLEVVGSYHSHPSGNAAPSLADAERAGEQGCYWLIATGGEFRLWLSRKGGQRLGAFDPVEIEIV